MNHKIKICHVIGDFVNGGVEAVIYNYFSNMDLSKYEVHIIGHGIRVQECADRFSALGFIIHNVTPKRISLKKSVKEMGQIFRENSFDIVHSHLTEWACVPMFLAWKCGVKVRINHSHMAEKPKGLKNRIYYGVRFILGKLFSTDYFACGKDAGRYLFGDKAVDNGKVVILPNAVDFSKFRYNEDVRRKTREKLNLQENTVVVGHVGRFFAQKNHSFLVDVFNEYLKYNNNSILVLLGDGELIQNIKEKVLHLGIDDKVLFLGIKDDVNNWYQAMDCFLLPSLYEGFPVVGVEAQISGLPCLFSDEITSEVKITDDVQFFGLKETASAWSKKLIELLKTPNSRIEISADKNYDINYSARLLNDFYLSKCKKL